MGFASNIQELSKQLRSSTSNAMRSKFKKYIEDNFISLLDKPNLRPDELNAFLLILKELSLSFNKCTAQQKKLLIDKLRKLLPEYSPHHLSNSLLSLNQIGLNWSDIEKLKLTELFISALENNLMSYSSNDTALLILTLESMVATWVELKKYKLDEIFIKILRLNLDSFNGHKLAKCLLHVSHMGLSWRQLKSFELDDLIIQLLKQKIRAYDYSALNQLLLAFKQLGLSWFDIKKMDLDNLINDAINKKIKPCNEQKASTILPHLSELKLSWADLKEFNLDQLFIALLLHDGKSFKTNDIPKILLALDRMGLTWADLIVLGLDSLFMQGMTDNLGHFNSFQKSILLLALSRMYVPANDCRFEALLPQLTLDVTALKGACQRQQLQAHYFLHYYFDAQLFPLPKEITTRTSALCSKLQSGVHTVLKRVSPLSFKQEENIGPFAVDFLIGNQLVLEVNGPTHFDAAGRHNDSKRTNLLEKMGYKVIQLDYQCWWDAEDKDLFLIRLMTSVEKQTLPVQPMVTTYRDAIKHKEAASQRATGLLVSGADATGETQNLKTPVKAKSKLSPFASEFRPGRS